MALSLKREVMVMIKKYLAVICVLVLTIAAFPMVRADMVPGDLNTYGTCRIEGGYKVFTGPGTDYLRINGNASCNDVIAKVWGIEDKWIMMSYQTSKGNYRVGYIEKSALQKASNVQGEIKNELEFLYDDGVINKKTGITDDPFEKNTAFATLKKNTDIIILGYLADWAYIEVLLEDETPARGFVKVENITTDGTIITGGSSVITTGKNKATVPPRRPRSPRRGMAEL